MPHSTLTLSTDDIDDLIYFSRTGDLDSLKESISSSSEAHSCPPASTVMAAIDVDTDGIGSGSTLLHYPAANGNLEVVEYLLSLLKEEPATSNETVKSQALTRLVNLQNVSGNTPLHWAGMNGHLAVVKALVGAGADPEIVNAAGRDAVVESEWSSKEGSMECAEWILKECGALEKGVGGEVERDDEGEEEGDVVMREGEVDDDIAAEGSAKKEDGVAE